VRGVFGPVTLAALATGQAKLGVVPGLPCCR
jgi:hypothetical protein